MKKPHPVCCGWSLVQAHKLRTYELETLTPSETIALSSGSWR